MKLLIINGPNINMLGIREKEKYGNRTLDEIVEDVKKTAASLNIQVDFFQSNIEGEIVGIIQDTYNQADGIIINPAAYTHYSVAILDAIKAVGLPCIEVHMTNILARDEFRKKSITAQGCLGVMAGFGSQVYSLAVRAMYAYLKDGR